MEFAAEPPRPLRAPREIVRHLAECAERHGFLELAEIGGALP